MTINMWLWHEFQKTNWIILNIFLRVFVQHLLCQKKFIGQKLVLFYFLPLLHSYKARLVAKVFTLKNGNDYKEIFSLVSKNDSLRIVLVLVKIAFLNGGLEEEVYMNKPEWFVSTRKEHLVCKLKKSIYGLKQGSRQWYLKFTITPYGFVENTIDRFIYMKVSGRIFVILILYVGDIFLYVRK